MLQKTYSTMMSYAATPKATWWLSLIAFAESSIFPLPPDPLLIAIILNRRESAWALATLCTLSSVVGGLLGYAIGYALYETVGQAIAQTYGMEQKLVGLQTQFQQWGFWIVTLKGFTPIPYKIVTIASGLAGLNLGTFICASLLARGMRFFLVAGLLWRWGPDIRDFIEQWLGWLTGLTLLGLIAGFIILRYI
ncbi:MAG: YqaA family protein [Pseudomonadota bacterium]